LKASAEDHGDSLGSKPRADLSPGISFVELADQPLCVLWIDLLEDGVELVFEPVVLFLGLRRTNVEEVGQSQDLPDQL
jgi:hypothetical protein